MAPKQSLLKKMKANPSGDWKMKDVETLCKQNSLTLAKPTRGSHFVIHSPYIDGILTVPFRRPIKTVYIRALVGLCEAHNGRPNNK